ncbi:radical SAM protein [Arcicella sp. LKC2W]|uniref:radical SAM protein n=1 Tax=Arcicella sp. LKC2W TaxID=2984198 RepID=UPI002B2115B3|nr:radical SAM protein [Arcicella sp. LKC2W]MEA5460949.1 radical SAM protein [Arcicella sp. LKC2W]
MKVSANIRGVVLKVASRCNLNCEYCYMYNLGDETYKLQPKFMSDEVVDNLLLRIQNYISKNNIKDFQFIFHGGEPLLIQPTFYQKFIKKANLRFINQISLDYIIQTNGVLLSPKWCKILGNLGIKIGISIDGMTEQANRFRVNHQGVNSLAETLIGIKNAQQSRHLKYLPSILTVINSALEPKDLYQQYKEKGIRNINVLLPDGTYDNLPFGHHFDDTVYGNWLIELFDNWFYDTDKNKPQISVFNQLIHLILGGDGIFDSWGGSGNVYLIIETNGDIEPQDSLKSCGDGFTKTHLNVQQNEFEDIFEHQLFKKCLDSQQRLSKKCQSCEVVDVCNGGFITHRFSHLSGFDNPSIYCKDLEKLIRHISESIELQIVTKQ